MRVDQIAAFFLESLEHGVIDGRINQEIAVGGASRDGLLAYGHASGTSQSALSESIHEYLEKGYRAIRVQTAFDTSRDDTTMTPSFSPGSAGGPKTAFFDTGLSYQPGDDSQFDIRVGVGVNDDSSGYYVGTGYAVRWK